MLVTTVALAAITFAYRAAASLLPRIPDPLVRRAQGLAPALLAALVVSELAGREAAADGGKVAAVAVAITLAAVRAPVWGCVAAGAVVAAGLRAAGVG